MSDDKPRKRYRLVLEDAAPQEAVPADLRFRAALKSLLRRFALRCVESADATDGAEPAPWESSGTTSGGAGS